MRRKFKHLGKYILLSCLAGLGLLGLSSFENKQNLFEVYKNMDILLSAVREVELTYVDEINVNRMVRSGLDAMLSELDPYTEFIPEDSVDLFRETHLSSEYGGIGALIQKVGKNVVISEVLEGQPAQKSDLRAGDILLKINETDVREKNADEIGKLLRGHTKSTIKLSIQRPGESQEIIKTLQRQGINVANISYQGWLAPGIGYIKLDRFLENSAHEVREALIRLKKSGSLKGLVFDLRGNGGGIMLDAVKIANLFLPKGSLIVTQRGRDKNSFSEYLATSEPVDSDVPLVLLANEESASASEIVCAAIQENERGVVIGQRTYGKGLVQNTTSLTYNSLLKLTIARYYTPSGRSIQALDYSKRNSSGKAEKMADSLITAFKTRKGRTVYNGNGVFPDIETKVKNYHETTQELFAQNMVFDFATQYRITHPNIAAATNFSINDSDYELFKKFLAERNFQYESQAEKLCKELEESLKEESQDGQAAAAIKRLKENAEKIRKQKELDSFKNEICDVLESEICSRYYFQKGRLESSFDEDSEIQQSLDLLKTPQAYQSILSGVGSYGDIGKPLQQKSEEESNNSGDSEEEDNE